jgi:tetratricopeptide (TPR) repeat protein
MLERFMGFNSRFCILTILLFSSLLTPQKSHSSTKWVGNIPPKFDKSEDWQNLLRALEEKMLFYGLKAAAERSLLYFSDLKVKELAYQEIVALIDRGYRYDLKDLFAAGDLDIKGIDGFYQTYNMYKSIINSQKKMTRWSSYYADRVDKEGFPKYLFYTGLQNYQNSKFEEALEKLTKALKALNQPKDIALAKKISRTLARIYYELGNFKKSWEIYDTYLLRLNPIEPHDWLEGAWNLYQLDRFSEALGLLYNLESEATENDLYLEKYVVRSLIYKQYCLADSMKKMMTSFEEKYGKTINAIKMGESVQKQPLLTRISLPENVAHEAFETTLQELQIEQKKVSSLPSKLRPLANFLYTSEIKTVSEKMRPTTDVTLQVRAKYLVIMGESLRFMMFDVDREKFNPEKVFAKPPPPLPPPDKNAISFQKTWYQLGDFWRDERNIFYGDLISQCR